MRLISLARAEDGTALGRDVLIGRPDGVPLLRAGVKVTPRYRELLAKAGISAIYVEDEFSAGIEVEPIIDDHTRAVATRAVANAYSSVRAAMSTGQRLRPEAVAELQDVVRRILEQIESSGGAALALADLSSADGYTFQHSIDVTALGLLVGHRYFSDYGWLDFRGERHFDQIEERLSTLGVGLLLHDIGKLAIPLGILNKPGKLTPEEWTIMKSHPRAGVDMLDASRWSPLIKSVVLRHHERWNGTGYPDGKAGIEIHQMARIAAVADVYDAITSERLYAPARPACDGVRAIIEGAGTLFDPEITETFCRVVAPFPAGTEVELTDGRQGIVVSVPDGALDRPTVRVAERDGSHDEISLLLDTSLGIEGWAHQAIITPLAA
ncbi:MAG TPA: HD-GYP domain-containing protein [Solirubrobacteraceae bacterium]|nr:HD-GYP domain-containing protein [Solirubrobacteraceae bacterium]